MDFFDGDVSYTIKCLATTVLTVADFRDYCTPFFELFPAEKEAAAAPKKEAAKTDDAAAAKGDAGNLAWAF